MTNRKDIAGMKAYSYIRWSSDPQTKGDSLARQIERTRAVCASLGLNLDETLIADRGVSGYTGKNLHKGALGKFIEAVESGRVKTPFVLVVEGLDRVTRMRVRDARKLFERLLELDVKICTAHNEAVYDESSLDNPVEMLISLMELSAGHAYSQELGRKLAAAWTRKKIAAGKGTLLTRRVPGWLTYNEKTRKIEKIDERVKIVQQIFKDFLGGKGTRLITLDLNRRGIKPFGHGKGWADTTVRRFLQTTSVIGQYQPRKYISSVKSIAEGTAVDDYYPAIVSKVDFYAVQERIKERRTPTGPRNNCVNLFSGLVKCAHCGWPVVIKIGAFAKATTRKPYIRLLCSKAWRGQGCVHRTVRYEAFERGVISALCVKLILSAEKRQAPVTDLAKLKAELLDTQARLELLSNAVRTAPEIPKNLVALSSELETKIENLRVVIATHHEGPASNLFAIWTPLVNTIDNRRNVQTLLTSEIKSIELNSEHFSAKIHSHGGETWEIAWDEDWEHGFLWCYGERREYQYYLDNILFWKSPLNPKSKPQGKTVDETAGTINLLAPNLGFPVGVRAKITQDRWSGMDIVRRRKELPKVNQKKGK